MSTSTAKGCLGLAAFVVAASGCNGLLGIDDPDLASGGVGQGGGGKGGAAAAGTGPAGQSNVAGTAVRTGGAAGAAGQRSGAAGATAGGGGRRGGAAGAGGVTSGGTVPTGGVAGGQASGGATAAGQGGESGASFGGGAGGVAPMGGAGLSGGVAAPGGLAGTAGQTTGGTSISSGGAGVGGSGALGGVAGTTAVAGAGGFGDCPAGTRQCRGNLPQLCNTNGFWEDQAECPSTAPTCASGTCSVPPSCAAGLLCSDRGSTVSCCTSIVVPGGTFLMGRGTESCDACVAGCPPESSYCSPEEQPEFSATLGRYRLDKYEVTVGRFRGFVESYDKTELISLLTSGAGAFAPVAGTGWNTAWNDLLPADRAAVEARITRWSNPTWTSTAGTNEQLPINQVNWSLAYAFCAWDGGWLATAAQWEFAAAGGSENRLYPWGPNPPTGYAVYGRNAVGSNSSGNGRWSHSDLAGNISEWVFDFRNGYTAASCTECVQVVDTTNGHYVRDADFRSASLTGYMDTADMEPGFAVGAGLRCARDP